MSSPEAPYVAAEKWDQRFLDLAAHIAGWSKDPSTQVGAVIVDYRRVVVGMGYNGFPRGVEDDPDRYEDRDTKYKFIVHAELNAILSAGHKARGGCLYIWPSFGIPNICSNCARAAIQAGIYRIVGYEPILVPEQAARWKDELDAARQMCDEAGVIYEGVLPWPT